MHRPQYYKYSDQQLLYYFPSICVYVYMSVHARIYTHSLTHNYAPTLWSIYLFMFVVRCDKSRRYCWFSVIQPLLIRDSFSLTRLLERSTSLAAPSSLLLYRFKFNTCCLFFWEKINIYILTAVFNVAEGEIYRKCNLPAILT